MYYSYLKKNDSIIFALDKLLNDSRPAFYNFGASKSGGRRIICILGTSWDEFWGSKVAEGSVGLLIFGQQFLLFRLFILFIQCHFHSFMFCSKKNLAKRSAFCLSPCFLFCLPVCLSVSVLLFPACSVCLSGLSVWLRVKTILAQSPKMMRARPDRTFFHFEDSKFVDPQVLCYSETLNIEGPKL